MERKVPFQNKRQFRFFYLLVGNFRTIRYTVDSSEVAYWNKRSSYG